MRHSLTTTLMAVALAAATPALHAADPFQPKPYVQFRHADWTRNASIYQINTRQFTPEGTFRAATAQLPRLKALGVDILWLMPIHPIGEFKRKGVLGSPYAVRDFRAVNPEFGSIADFRGLVDTAHKLGMHVILDWVGNHSAWDNVLRTSHPDWYVRGSDGKPQPTPWFDWDDIVDLDYSKPALRRYMFESMKYWVKDVGVDGFRADAAGLVPQDFWDHASAELRAIKPVFMLAEWESRDMHRDAFDASYAWTWWDTLHDIAKGKKDATALYPYYAWNRKFYPRQAYRLLYTTNHDKNAWDGTEFETFGDAVDAAIVFSFVSEGMPMIYNGQEVGNRKRLAFFGRDPIDWKDSPYTEFYRKLLALRKTNSALWNGEFGAVMDQVPNSAPKQVFSFVRANPKDKVFVVLNLSAAPVKASFSQSAHHGQYRDFASGAAIRVDAHTSFELAPWSYRLLVK
jgi:glycosidase